jgi:kynurenine formamidase
VCESPDAPALPGWNGWLPLEEQAPVTPVGPWVDLTHPLTLDPPRLPSFPAPTLTRVKEMPADPFNLSRLELIVHSGTHVDAPRHFVADGPAMEEVPLERLLGRGVVIGLDQQPDGLIEPADLEQAEPQIEPGDIVAIDCGWDRRWRTADWERHPSLSPAAARWLVDRRVKLVALDVATPDLPLARRPPEFGFPVHRTLLAHGVLIAESVANLGALAGSRVELCFGALPVAGSDGAPARALARKIAT